MVRTLTILGIVTSFVTVAAAQNLSAIAARQAIYKSFGKATRPVAGMLKGDSPFDATVVKAALATYADGAGKLPALFPDDSKTGGDTGAAPEIWSHKDDFNARLTKFGADSTAAIAAISDEASFKATMPKILGQCGSCHKEYRAKT